MRDEDALGWPSTRTASAPRWGSGEVGRAKVLPWLFVAASLVPAIVFALLAGAVDRLAADFDEALDLPSHADYYSVAAVILLVFAAVVGPELLCPDRRSGVIHLYLVRPLTPGDYAGSRWAALVTIMVIAAWLPQFVLLAGLVLSAPDPGSYLADKLARHPAVPGRGPRAGPLRGDARLPSRVVHDETRVCGRVSRWPLPWSAPQSSTA